MGCLEVLPWQAMQPAPFPPSLPYPLPPAGVSPAAVALGASYFQRLLAGSEPLRNSALQVGGWGRVGRMGDFVSAGQRLQGGGKEAWVG